LTVLERAAIFAEHFLTSVQASFDNPIASARIASIEFNATLA
jgi:hypothetical protein